MMVTCEIKLSIDVWRSPLFNDTISPPNSGVCSSSTLALGLVPVQGVVIRRCRQRPPL